VKTPLHEGHLDLMSHVTRMGGIIMPPVPAFYQEPKTIDDLINQTVGKVLDLFSVDNDLFKRWGTVDYKKVVQVCAHGKGVSQRAQAAGEGRES
jgi:4-hydroxy-3-polyprenylbenzoate decarboxylase